MGLAFLAFFFSFFFCFFSFPCVYMWLRRCAHSTSVFADTPNNLMSSITFYSILVAWLNGQCVVVALTAAAANVTPAKIYCHRLLIDKKNSSSNRRGSCFLCELLFGYAVCVCPTGYSVTREHAVVICETVRFVTLPLILWFGKRRSIRFCYCRNLPTQKET